MDAGTLTALIAIATIGAGLFTHLYSLQGNASKDLREALDELRGEMNRDRQQAAESRLRVTESMGLMATREDLNKSVDRLIAEVDRRVWNRSHHNNPGYRNE